MTIAELLSVEPSTWTPEHETELEQLLVQALQDGSVLRVNVPVTSDEQVAHCTLVCRRIQERNSLVILSGGRVYDGEVMKWTWSGYTQKVKQAIREARGEVW